MRAQDSGHVAAALLRMSALVLSMLHKQVHCHSGTIARAKVSPLFGAKFGQHGFHQGFGNYQHRGHRHYNPCGSVYRNWEFCRHKPAGHYGHQNDKCYIQCDSWGRGYLRPCAQGTYWHGGRGPTKYNKCVGRKHYQHQHQNHYYPQGPYRGPHGGGGGYNGGHLGGNAGHHHSLRDYGGGHGGGGVYNGGHLGGHVGHHHSLGGYGGDGGFGGGRGYNGRHFGGNGGYGGLGYKARY